MAYLSYWFTDFAVRALTLNLFVVRKLLKTYFENKTKRVLDLGCGIGTMAPLFHPSKYIGIDIDADAIEYAKKCHRQYKFGIADATNFNLHKKFDTVLMVGVLHHLSDSNVASTLKCVSGHIRGDGNLVIIEAIPPIHKWNLFGYLLRALDKGRFIRSTTQYKRLIERHFKISVCGPQIGGLLDYAFIITTSKIR